jgi:hypothetical protein
VTIVWGISVTLLLALLTLVAYVDRIYFEMGKFLSREYTENIEAWELVEPKLHLSRESAAMSASVLRQTALVALTFLLAFRLHGKLSLEEIARTAFELLLVLLVCDRLIPQIFFTKTRGEWIGRIVWLLQALFYLVLPVTLSISLLLSIAGLAEPEVEEPEHASEAVDALLEAGEEEGVLDEHDEETEADAPVAEPEGTWLVPGWFEVSRLRDLFEEREEEPCDKPGEEDCIEEAPAEEDEEVTDPRLSQLISGYEATTIGGLVSEIAGHIPLPGEVVEDGPLRLEVIASTDRLVERVRVGLKGTPAASEPE